VLRQLLSRSLADTYESARRCMECASQYACWQQRQWCWRRNIVNFSPHQKQVVSLCVHNCDCVSGRGSTGIITFALKVRGAGGDASGCRDCTATTPTPAAKRAKATAASAEAATPPRCTLAPNSASDTNRRLPKWTCRAHVGGGNGVAHDSGRRICFTSAATFSQTVRILIMTASHRCHETP
jgi:hypothetical protein